MNSVLQLSQCIIHASFGTPLKMTLLHKMKILGQLIGTLVLRVLRGVQRPKSEICII